MEKIAKLEYLYSFFADFSGGGANVPSAPSVSATASGEPCSTSLDFLKLMDMGPILYMHIPMLVGRVRGTLQIWLKICIPHIPPFEAQSLIALSY